MLFRWAPQRRHAVLLLMLFSWVGKDVALAFVVTSSSAAGAPWLSMTSQQIMETADDTFLQNSQKDEEGAFLDEEPSSTSAASLELLEPTTIVGPTLLETVPDKLVSRRSAIVGALMTASGVFTATTTLAVAAQEEEARLNDEASQTRGASDELVSSMLVSDAAAASAASATVDWKAIFQRASKRALGGGRAGASAAVVQVCSLMWLRTSMNYQYRYGGNLKTSLQTLWNQGGVARLYQGLPFALVQGPLTRFGDTAANVGILALLNSLPETQDLPLPLKTACGSVAAGLWRIVLMPVDSSKTVMQVEGSDGLSRLWQTVRDVGPAPLYQGALAQAAATAAGHFPWFLTYNFLDEQLPVVLASDDLFMSLVRAAVLGLSASCVSDCVSNSLRVIKTTKQTAQVGRVGNDDAPAVAASEKSSGGGGTVAKELSYQEVLALILEKDGVAGLFGRGLQTRLLTNAIQGAVFSVLWKYFQQSGGM